MSGANTFTVALLEHLGPGPTSLWRVSNGSSEVLIGGTIHYLLPTDFPLPPAYAEAYAMSQLLVTELDLLQTQSTFLLPSFAALPVGQPTLSQTLSAETYLALSLYLSERGVIIDNYETVRPNWLDTDLVSIALAFLGYEAGVADHNIILADRNASWVPKIVALFDTPEVELVLVGVSHLVGDDSVLALLEDMGFQVTRY